MWLFRQILVPLNNCSLFTKTVMVSALLHLTMLVSMALLQFQSSKLAITVTKIHPAHEAKVVFMPLYKSLNVLSPKKASAVMHHSSATQLADLPESSDTTSSLPGAADTKKKRYPAKKVSAGKKVGSQKVAPVKKTAALQKTLLTESAKKIRQKRQLK